MSYVNSTRLIFMLLFLILYPSDNVESHHSKCGLEVELCIILVFNVELPANKVLRFKKSRCKLSI